LWARLEEEKGQKKDVMWLNLSALHAEGTTGLLDILFKRVPESPLLFPEDILTDFPRKWTIADSIREKYFLSLKHELPHAIAVEVPGIEEHEDGSWDVDTVVYVNRPSQKGIVIGHKGRMIRKVRRQAEHELSEMYDRPVRVRIRVKIEKKWAGNFWMLKRLGYQ
jgi:GTP-binding protein Era